MALDAQRLTPEPRPLLTGSTPTTGPLARGARARRPIRAAVRRRFDEAALAAAVRELRTRRNPRLPG